MKLFKYKDFIKKFINKSKRIDSICKKYGIKNYTINDDGSIDVDGDVDISYKKLIKLPLKFRNVSGYFWCFSNELTSLKGSPQSVGGDFDCHNNQLVSLEGAPQSVGDDFECSNNQLTSLEGASESMGGHFWCGYNQLIHFEGFPPLYNKTKRIGCRGNPIEEVYSLYNTIECAEWLNEEEVINYKDQDGNLLKRPFVYYMKLKDVYDYLEMEPLDIDQVRSRLKHYEVIG